MSSSPPLPLSRDTPLEVERRWIEILREKGPAFRLEKTLELSSSCRRNALAAYRRLHPDASAEQEREWMLRACYGDEFTDRYLAWRAASGHHERG